MEAGARVDELGRDPQRVSGLAHAAFNDVRNSQGFSDCLDRIPMLAAEMSGGSARRNLQSGHACESMHQLFTEAFAQIVVGRVSAQVVERKNCDRLRRSS